jgi:hypothetical protein
MGETESYSPYFGEEGKNVEVLGPIGSVVVYNFLHPGTIVEHASGSVPHFQLVAAVTNEDSAASSDDAASNSAREQKN